MSKQVAILGFVLLFAPVLVPLTSIIAALELMASWHWHLALAVPGLLFLAFLGFRRTKPTDVFVRALALMNIGMAADLCLTYLVKSDNTFVYDWPLSFLLPLPWCAVMWFRSGIYGQARTMLQSTLVAVLNTIGMALLAMPMVIMSYPVWFRIDTNGPISRFDNIQVIQSIRGAPPFFYSLDDRKFLKHLLQTRYLWYDQGRTRAADRETSLGAFFQRAIDPLDKWSYIGSGKDFVADAMGSRNGTGITEIRRLADRTIVLQVEPASPAARAGIKRGDAIFAVNGVDVWVMNRPVPNGIDRDRRTFLVSRNGGQTDEVNVNKGQYKSTEVGVPKVFDVAGRKVGYLQYDSFAGIARERLMGTMWRLRQQKVSELILDLRYNGGGSISEVEILAGMLAPKSAMNQVALRETYKPSRAIAEKVPLITPLQIRPVDSPTRLIVIASESTCSASESLIMLLRPYMDVVVIGSRTCGKPYGMEIEYYNDKVYAPISFSVKNSRGEMGDIAGIEPTCLAEDDPKFELGDIREASLAEAVFYSEFGRCRSGAGE
jgi:C-terminal processing protease CtpA/Prc